jgi:ribonuclease P protein component
MKRIQMIKKQKDFQTIIHNQNYVKNKYYVIYFIENNDFTHYGMAISKKYGNAVERNKAKRITRNLIDNNKILFKKNLNYIIMIKGPCKNTSFNILNDSMQSLLKEIK